MKRFTTTTILLVAASLALAQPAQETSASQIASPQYDDDSALSSLSASPSSSSVAPSSAVPPCPPSSAVPSSASSDAPTASYSDSPPSYTALPPAATVSTQHAKWESTLTQHAEWESSSTQPAMWEQSQCTSAITVTFTVTETASTGALFSTPSALWEDHNSTLAANGTHAPWTPPTLAPTGLVPTGGVPEVPANGTTAVPSSAQPTPTQAPAEDPLFSNVAKKGVGMQKWTGGAMVGACVGAFFMGL